MSFYITFDIDVAYINWILLSIYLLHIFCSKKVLNQSVIRMYKI